MSFLVEISEIDLLKAEIALIKAENEALRESANFRAIQSLRGDCEALRKDAERYRWLRDGAGYCDTGDIPGMAPARMDAFIDAALAKELDQ